MWRAYFLSLLCIFLSAHATIYQNQVDHVMVYSDMPAAGAHVLAVPTVSILNTTISNPSKAQQNNPQEKKDPIPEIHLVGISAGQTIPYGEPLRLSIQGGNAQQYATVVIDGKVYGRAENGVFHIDVDQLPRGTHTIQALLRDERQQLLVQTPVAEFYVQQHSIANNQGG